MDIEQAMAWGLCEGRKALERGDLRAALGHFEAVLTQSPNQVDALCGFARAARALNRTPSALAAADRAVRLVPDHYEARTERGFSLHTLGQHARALDDFEGAIRLEAVPTAAHYGRVLALAALGRFAEVIAAAQCVVDAVPTHAGAIKAKGIALRQLGDWSGALQCYDEALLHSPYDPSLRAQRSLALLATGDYRDGFKEYEHRFGLMGQQVALSGAPPWRGDMSLHDKVILLTYEQGLGDAIQFARYVPDVARLAKKVVICLPRTLVDCFRSLDEDITCISLDDVIPPHDVQCPLNSLPMVFSCVLEALPYRRKYLRARPDLVSAWRHHLPPYRCLRIALAWRGRNYFPFPDPRAVDLAALVPILNLDIEIVVLQPDLQPNEKALLEGFAHVRPMGHALTDFAQIAAILEQVDIVVTVDTSFAHLGGALGKPTWVMNRFANCWRWLIGRDDSPWYPSMRLFRQANEGCWPSVIGQIADALRRESELRNQRITL